MLNIDAGTATHPEKESLSDQTGNMWAQNSKSYFYKKAFSDVDFTSSSANENFTKSIDTVEGGLDSAITRKKNWANDEPIKAIRNIYFQDEFITPELRNGFNLLKTSQSFVVKALENIEQGNRKDSDEYIMQFKTSLPELFCCRNISESFGAVINSIHNALSNMKGQPLSKNQIAALHDIINGLLREPAMSFDKAVDYVSEFEEADFEVESVGLQGLLELVEIMNEDEMELVNG